MLGQSWGGMLGAEYGHHAAAGLKSLTIANSPASMELWVRKPTGCASDLPRDSRMR